jgi:hypothetical protein
VCAADRILRVMRNKSGCAEKEIGAATEKEKK